MHFIIQWLEVMGYMLGMMAFIVVIAIMITLADRCFDYWDRPVLGWLIVIAAFLLLTGGVAALAVS